MLKKRAKKRRLKSKVVGLAVKVVKDMKYQSRYVEAV